MISNYRRIVLIEKIQIPPNRAKTEDTIKIAEKPNILITAAARTGAKACVIVFPKLYTPRKKATRFLSGITSRFNKLSKEFQIPIPSPAVNP